MNSNRFIFFTLPKCEGSAFVSPGSTKSLIQSPIIINGSLFIRDVNLGLQKIDAVSLSFGDLITGQPPPTCKEVPFWANGYFPIVVCC